MPEDIQLCEKTLVKPVVMKPSEMRKKDKEPVDQDTEGTALNKIKKGEMPNLD